MTYVYGLWSPDMKNLYGLCHFALLIFIYVFQVHEEFNINCIPTLTRIRTLEFVVFCVFYFNVFTLRGLVGWSLNKPGTNIYFLCHIVSFLTTEFLGEHYR